MGDMTRSWTTGVRRIFSAVLLSSLLSLSMTPLAVKLGRDEDHRCTCCQRATCKCCKRFESAASGPLIGAKRVCPGGCGCVGALRTPAPISCFLVPARHADVQLGTALLLALAGAHLAAETPDPLHQRPPPCLPA